MVEDARDRIDYDESGQVPTVVLMPGSCSTGATWRPVIAAVPTLSLPHHRELHQDLPEEPEPGEGDRRDQEADRRAHDLTGLARRQ
jgi:hypothetical protein